MKKSHFLQRVLVGIVAFLVLFAPANNTLAAVSQSQLQFNYENDIMFYKKDDCQNYGPSKPTGSSITWVGGSISSIYSMNITSKFQGIDAGGGSYIGEGKTAADAINTVQSIVEGKTMRKVLVFAIGEDGGIEESQLDQLMSIVGASTNVVIPTLRTKDDAFSSSNAAISSAKTKYNNMRVADWEAVAKGHLDDWFGDKYPNETGVNNWLSIINNALPSIYLGGSSESGTFVAETESSGMNPYSHWEGGCYNVSGNAVYSKYLEENADGVIELASRYDLPWEALVGQLFNESGGGLSDLAVNCNNPLGLKGTGNAGKCGVFAKFNTIEDSYNYYATKIGPVKRAQGMYKESPYSLIEFIQYSPGSHYAVCDKQEYIDKNMFSCGGHQLGDPTPHYVRVVSELICGIQKWAIANGKKVSSENFQTFDSSHIITRPDGTVPASSASGVRVCSGSGYGAGIPRDNGDIVATAMTLGWPQSERKKHSLNDPSPSYQQAMESLGIWQNPKTNWADNCTRVGASCDVFVATVMRYSGADPNFPLYLGGQKPYLAQHTELYDAFPASAVEPRAGDIRIENGEGHIVLIVDIGDGKLGIASASHCDRTGDINGYYAAPGGTIYRMKQQ